MAPDGPPAGTPGRRKLYRPPAGDALLEQLSEEPPSRPTEGSPAKRPRPGNEDSKDGRLKWLFEAHATERSGRTVLARDELAGLLDELLAAGDWTAAQLSGFMDLADTDRDGAISWPEFKETLGAVFPACRSPAASPAKPQPDGGLAARPVAASRVRVLKTVLPQDADHQQRLRPGVCLQWIDLAALACSRCHSGQNVVAGSSNAIHFHQPAAVGETVTLEGCVTRTFGSAMEIQVRVTKQDRLAVGPPSFCCTCFTTFIALTFEYLQGTSLRSMNQAWRPARAPTPELSVATEEERRLFDSALERKAARKQFVQAEIEQPPQFDQRAFDAGLPGAGAVVPMAEATLKNVMVVLPSQANPYQTCLGGLLMTWICDAATLVSERHAQRDGVVVSIDPVNFHSPIWVGELVTLHASVTRVFRTTMEVLVEVFAEDRWRESNKFRHNKRCHAYLTVAAVDQDRNPVQVARKVLPRSESEKIRYQNAQRRRQLRIEEKVRQKALFSTPL